MPIAKSSGGDFQPCPAGSHLARCVGVISLGTQAPNNPQFNASFKVMVVWELPDEMVPGKNVAMTVSKDYSCFLSDKANLRHDLESWRGRPFTPQELEGFDVAQVLDVPCMISVIHKTSAKKTIYAAVTSVSRMPKSMVAKPRVNELVHFEIEQGRDTTFQSLPEWVKKKIEACEEWRQSPPGNPQAMRAPEGEPERESEPESDQPPSDQPPEDDVPF